MYVNVCNDLFKIYLYIYIVILFLFLFLFFVFVVVVAPFFQHAHTRLVSIPDFAAVSCHTHTMRSTKTTVFG